MSDMKESEASRVIRKCGGTTKTASLLNVSVSSVSKWNAPKGKGGADGRVPSKHALSLLQIGVIGFEDLEPPDVHSERRDGTLGAEAPRGLVGK